MQIQVKLNKLDILWRTDPFQIGAGVEDLQYVPGYLNRLIDLLLKRHVPLSITETARLQSDRHVLSNWEVN